MNSELKQYEEARTDFLEELERTKDLLPDDREALKNLINAVDGYVDVREQTSFDLMSLAAEFPKSEEKSLAALFKAAAAETTEERKDKLAARYQENLMNSLGKLPADHVLQICLLETRRDELQDTLAKPVTFGAVLAVRDHKNSRLGETFEKMMQSGYPSWRRVIEEKNEPQSPTFSDFSFFLYNIISSQKVAEKKAAPYLPYSDFKKLAQLHGLSL